MNVPGFQEISFARSRARTIPAAGASSGRDKRSCCGPPNPDFRYTHKRFIAPGDYALNKRRSWCGFRVCWTHRCSVPTSNSRIRDTGCRGIVGVDHGEYSAVFVKEGSVLNKHSRSHEKLIHGIKLLTVKNLCDGAIFAEAARSERSRAVPRSTPG